jgi:hypothetical protein
MSDYTCRRISVSTNTTADLTKSAKLLTKGPWQSAKGERQRRSMVLIVIFLLGIGNFAMHKAVLESGHPMIERIGWMRPRSRVPVSLVLEFAILLATLLFAANGWPGLAPVYAIYSALNALSAWAILTGRI